MSVATKNPFAILDAEDPSRPSSPAPAPASEGTQPVPTPSTRGNQKGRGGSASRGGRYYTRGGAANKGRDQNPEEAPPASGNDTAQRKFDGNGRGRGKGRGRGDRSRAGPDGGGGRGRQFDRHSQTGKTDSDKKVHQSWGGDDGITELKVEEAATNDAAVEDTNDWAGNTTNDWDTPAPPAADDPWAVPVSNDAPNAELEPTDKTAGEREPRRGREREPEEEDNTLTLPQYLAQKKDIEGIPKLDGPRKANEGVDDNIWKDVVPLKKDEEGNSYFVGKSKSTHKSRAKKEEKVFIEINPHFDRPSRGGRGRGGGDRGDRPPRGGGRTRGPPRPPPNGSVNVDDESAFPSLS